MKFLLPKINIYARKLSVWQEKLWDAIIPRPYSERWPSDEFRFCHNAYGMRSNKHFLMDFEAGKAVIQKSVSAFPYGVMSANENGLDTTVTIGSAIYDSVQTGTSPGSSIDYLAYGYANGVDYLSLSDFGTMPTYPGTGFKDGIWTPRTVSAIYYTEPGGTAAEDDNLYFCLNQTSVSDSVNTFDSIDYNSVNYTRASRGLYSGTVGSCSTWAWLNITPNGPTTGTVGFVINCNN